MLGYKKKSNTTTLIEEKITHITWVQLDLNRTHLRSWGYINFDQIGADWLILVDASI